jgi:glycosyltransferase involved in cell wall biosynthesis
MLKSESKLTPTLVIPVYKPQEKLLKLIKELRSQFLFEITVVDDGSGPESQEIFKKVAELEGVEVLHHAVNLGKGAALKTAFNHYLLTKPLGIGVVTLDADGQHLPHDVIKVSEALVNHPLSLVLGARSFNQDVPRKSLLGNKITGQIFRILVGKNLQDTQTGLRGIPLSLIKLLMTVGSNRYEFELEMLVLASRQKINILEVPISTVYEDGNKGSHFNPLLDSFRIYFVFLRFLSLSLITYGADVLIFSVLYFFSKKMFASIVIGRACAAAINLFGAKKFVFKSDKDNRRVITLYAMLWLSLLGISYGLMILLVQKWHFNVYFSRVGIDSALFIFNFLVQRDLIFNEDSRVPVTTRDKKRLLVIELNEFNKDLLKNSAEKFKFQNIQKLISLKEVVTVSPDTYESNSLEPWVQWVSIHTGTPFSHHKIQHLGDVPHLDNPQIWETLSEKGVSSGIWGAMNASRGYAKNNMFFLPDPWTFSEEGYPSKVAKLLELPRYASKNYLNLSKKKLFSKSRHFLQVLLTSGILLKLLAEIPGFIRNLIKYKGEHFVYISFADYALTLLFLEYKKKFDPDFSILFLNSLAHLQHHHWKGLDYENNHRLFAGLKYIDSLLEQILNDQAQTEKIIFLGGLSQKNTNNEVPWILYRPHDQSVFLRHMQIDFKHVEPHMTHDAHLFFENEDECRRASTILESAEIEGKKLFLVERYLDAPKKLFFRIDFTDEVAASSHFRVRGHEYLFSDFFKPIVVRTGKHIPNGTLYTNLDQVPAKMANHDVNTLIYQYFNLENKSVPTDFSQQIKSTTLSDSIAH